MTLPIFDYRLPICVLWSLALIFWLDILLFDISQSEIGNCQSAMIWLWRKDSNLRMAALTVRCLTNLATPQELRLAAATRFELVSSRLQDERSGAS
jgi:hypothetical protein